MVVSEAFSEALTRNLKAFARSYAAERAADQSVVEIVGSTPLDQLSEEQSFALLTLKKKRGELRKDEAVYVVSSAANTTQLVMFLNRTQTEAQVLAEQGKLLSQSVSVDFGSPEKIRQAPTVARGLQDSMSHLQRASSRATTLSKTLTRLGASLNSLL